MAIDPPCRMAPRRRFVMAPYAIVLTMTGGAALPVHTCGHAVTLVPPVVRMVTRRTRGVTGDAVVLFMTNEAGLPARSRFKEVRLGVQAVVLDPVPPVRVGTRERDLLHRRRDGSSCQQRGQEGHQDAALEAVRNHSVLPASRSGTGRPTARVHSSWRATIASPEKPCRSHNRS